jgi:2-polyprenyl-6-methoxyphenol hydroxylase-like FAD-dependent oxidoreductase
LPRQDLDQLAEKKRKERPIAMTPRFAIVGAGPAGLTAALAATKLGLNTTLFEEAPDFRRIGGGIALQSNGLRVLEALGLLDGFRPSLRFAQRGVVELPGGIRIAAFDGSQLKIPQPHIAVVLRYRLQEYLVSAVQQAGVSVHFGQRCTAARMHAERVVLEFADGAPQEFDGVVAADGVNSAVRDSLGLVARKLPTRRAYLRGVADIACEPDIMREIWGPDGHRFGICPLLDNQTYFFCSVAQGAWESIRDHRLAAWIDSWANCGPDPVNILRAVRDWKRVSYDEPQEVALDCWYRAPCFFIGDAAHAMTPDLGQGANSAMVDALVLMQLLGRAVAERDALESAGQAYDRLRRPFVLRIQGTSRRIGSMASWSSAPARLFRNLAMRATSKLGFLRRRTMFLGAGYHPAEESFFHWGVAGESQ